MKENAEGERSRRRESEDKVRTRREMVAIWMAMVTVGGQRMFPLLFFGEIDRMSCSVSHSVILESPCTPLLVTDFRFLF